MNAQIKNPHARRTPQQWQQLVNEFDPCHQSLHAYCKKKSIGSSSFYKWKAKLNKPDSAEKEEPPAFIPIKMPSQAIMHPASGWDVELELGHGLVLRISQS